MRRESINPPSNGRETASSNRILAIAGGVGLLLVGGYTWLGWGHWGFCVVGDYCLDMADALRVFQGDVPYRDFLPTYGALHMFLVAPLFGLGRSFFSSVWLLASALIFLQAMAICWMGTRVLSRFWLAVLFVLSLAAVAYGPINSKFILGYSSSGFLGSLMLTGALACLWDGARCAARWLAAGVFLGLAVFTKIDLGITALLLVLVLFAVWIRKAPALAGSLALGFGATWAGFCLFLVLNGGTVPLLVGSTLETFSQVSSFRDENLVGRLRLLLGLGLLAAIAWWLPAVRRQALRLERKGRPCAAGLLLLAIGVDLFRGGWQQNISKQLVGLNWVWMLIVVLVVARVAVAVVRTRSLRPLRFSRLSVLPALLVIAGMGFLRVMGSGWYPLNYYQPAVLILGVLWFARQCRDSRPGFQRAFQAVLALALVLQLAASLAGCVRSRLVWVPTPFGAIASSLPPDINEKIDRLVSRVNREAGEGPILSTYEPSIYVLTGIKATGLYTFFTRMGASGAYRALREEQGLLQLRERPPRLIVREREIGPVHGQLGFGVDYGKSILAFIRDRYEVADAFDDAVLYRLKGSDRPAGGR